MDVEGAPRRAAGRCSRASSSARLVPAGPVPQCRCPQTGEAERHERPSAHGRVRRSPDDRYFEDCTAGATDEYGSISVTEEEIVGFASQYDPQSFHVDPVAAKQGPFGGLVAGGWHTVALMMQLVAKHYLSKVAGLGSPGVDELRWLRPVRPGDRLRLHTLDTRLSRSGPRRGIVRTLAELLDQDGEPVLRVTVVNLLRTRDGA